MTFHSRKRSISSCLTQRRTPASWHDYSVRDPNTARLNKEWNYQSNTTTHIILLYMSVFSSTLILIFDIFCAFYVCSIKLVIVVGSDKLLVFSLSNSLESSWRRTHPSSTSSKCFRLVQRWSNPDFDHLDQLVPICYNSQLDDTGAIWCIQFVLPQLPVVRRRRMTCEVSTGSNCWTNWLAWVLAVHLLQWWSCSQWSERTGILAQLATNPREKAGGTDAMIPTLKIENWTSQLPSSSATSLVWGASLMNFPGDFWPLKGCFKCFKLTIGDPSHSRWPRLQLHLANAKSFIFPPAHDHGAQVLTKHGRAPFWPATSWKSLMF